MNRQIQPVSLPTDVRRDVQPTRTLVDDPTGERAGTITIDTKNRYLYLSMADGKAMRYEVGVGRDGFAWSGRARIGRRAEWPSWTPPAAMRLRRPDLPRVMEGGLAIRWAPAPCISTMVTAIRCFVSTAPMSRTRLAGGIFWLHSPLERRYRRSL